MKKESDKERYVRKNFDRVLNNFIKEHEINILLIPAVRAAVSDYFNITIMEQLSQEMNEKMVFKIEIQKVAKTREEMADVLRTVAKLVEDGYDSGMAQAWQLIKELPDIPDEEEIINFED